MNTTTTKQTADRPADRPADFLDRADNLRGQAARARQLYARTLSALLAEYVREMFPEASSLACEITPDASTDTGIDARLLAIYQDDAVVWAPAAIVSPDTWTARHGQPMPELSIGTVACIETALERIHDADADVFESVRDNDLGPAGYAAVRLDLATAYDQWYPGGASTGHTYHGHAVLEALANAANGLDESEVCAAVGPVLWFADITALTAHGYVSLGDIADGFRYRITPTGVQELTRARQQAAAIDTQCLIRTAVELWQNGGDADLSTRQEEQLTRAAGLLAETE